MKNIRAERTPEIARNEQIVKNIILKSFFFQLDSVTYVCIRVVSCYFRGKTEKD